MPSRGKLHDIRRMVEIDIVKSDDAYIRNVLGIIPSPGFFRCHGHENRLAKLGSTQKRCGQEVMKCNTATSAHELVCDPLPDDQILGYVVEDMGNLDDRDELSPYLR